MFTLFLGGKTCTNENAKIYCKTNYKYRTLDGSCNNVNYKWWGKSKTPYQRLVGTEYDTKSGDMKRLSKITGKELPNARSVSLAVHYPVEGVSMNTILFAMMGQSLADDLFLNRESRNPNTGAPIKCTCETDHEKMCNLIRIPVEDHVPSNQTCMAVGRSEQADVTFDCHIGYREQINMATSWLDLSFVYGTNAKQSDELRKKAYGFLKSELQPNLNQEYLLQDNIGKCTDEVPGKACFKSGSPNVDQNLLDASLATLFMREHNRLALMLKKLNNDWNDEKLFQEARRINIAQFQKIIYYDWLPLVVGDAFTNEFDFKLNPSYRENYDSTTLPNSYNELATAALQFGHSLVRSYVKKADENLKTTSTVPITDIIYRPVEAYVDGGLDALIRGMLVDPVNIPDAHITNLLENHIFQRGNDNENGTFRYSLGTLTINRGRDHGLASYNKYRQFCGLKLAQKFTDLKNIRPKDIENMKKVYALVDDVDLWTGGMSEIPLDNGVVGNTFACLISNFFYNLRNTDRFFYENSANNSHPFSKAQLNSIQTIDMKTILCNNVKLNRIQKNPFLVRNEEQNNYVECFNVKNLNMHLWKEQLVEEETTQAPIIKFITPNSNE